MPEISEGDFDLIRDHLAVVAGKLMAYAYTARCPSLDQEERERRRHNIEECSREISRIASCLLDLELGG